jgi:hypothetical protein
MHDDWRYEPCESDDPKYPHAARGVKPTPAGGRLVETGYGHSEKSALDDVRRRCAERDRNAGVGQRPALK